MDYHWYLGGMCKLVDVYDLHKLPLMHNYLNHKLVDIRDLIDHKLHRHDNHHYIGIHRLHKISMDHLGYQVSMHNLHDDFVLNIQHCDHISLFRMCMDSSISH